MSYYNATCRIMLASPEPGSNPLEPAKTWETLPERRCSVRQMSMEAERRSFGVLTMNTLVCRVRCEKEPAPGTRLQVKRDGRHDWQEFTVKRASGYHHWMLLIQGVG